MYGTSILQGGCANRPGMAHTNIISRRLDREVINLGFSGNALLDMEIAHLMASVEDPGLFVMDYVPNASAQAIDEVGEQFFRIVRDAHPDVPVVFIEDVIFPFSTFDNLILEEVTKKNQAQKRLYKKLKKSGEKRIYYIGAEGMIGDDGEATVDGIHFTDLGMMRYVDHVLPTLKKALKK
jgi:lysophospholipase L1-like esterase